MYNNSTKQVIPVSFSLSLLLAMLLLDYTTIAQQLLVPPYLQPGNAPTLSKEEKIVLWQTDSLPGTYKVEYSKV